ncbi:hypothetical protein CFE70_001477 [Pyrenophora teres f. teres 0-1]|uniref:Uncharacterized protein n=2 Tax=Pyrenophora teres f. teres TaxID=97479 RepID=E3RL80_PYRTT|nr:hypothetical protein PTT_09105 [Pyrenophora teres f. teres 0-1]KAE8842027.1 hypothetical protein HRS9139_01324 [Pyrenophora teres f. teres]KAE8850905.1 hypothetical protein PTNB85_01321 [Pyrenophora teres f. teres]KAE8851063.1 hypothetical protein HRS9122_01350 [Pyrenophora teres f. teres]KAE8869736.1 hypothetical protein PTNB29_00080 [Pyrenophora teres f. teres]
MTALNRPDSNRKPSKPNMLGERLLSSKDTRSSTPESTKSRTPSERGSLKKVINKLRGSGSRSSMMTPSPSTAPSTLPTHPLIISNLAKAFVDALNATQLSNFLTWMLYYDIAELADEPEAWYEPINGMEMRGWVALGSFLSKALKTKTGYGFDLIVLDAICDRTRISRTLVHELLIKFADPDSMRYSTIATTTQKALLQGCTQLEVLEAVEAKLHELKKLVLNLHPQPNSRYDEWHAMVHKRIRGFLNLVVSPRIIALRSDHPIITATTNQDMSKEVQQGFQLAYFYETMQQEREVPLSRYGIHADSVYGSPSPSRPLGGDEETERARRHAIHLMAENHKLRSTIAGLEQDKAELIDSNDKLAQRIGTLSRGQPADYYHFTSPTSPFYTAQSAMPPIHPVPNITVSEEPQDLQITPAPSHTRPRSISAGATPTSSTSSLVPPLNNYTHKRHSSSTASSVRNYDEVFSGLKDSSLPELRLMNPGSDEVSPVELLTTTAPEDGDEESVTACSEVERTLPARYRRRSRGFYDRRAVGYLAGVGEREREEVVGQPGEDWDDEDEGREIPLVVPSPRGSRRFDLLE